MKTHRRSARAARRLTGTPPTGGPVTANYHYFDGLDINVFATSEKGELLQALVAPREWTGAGGRIWARPTARSVG